ncbi:serendipity locus protein delta [Scaptodrosophila lebanonensis]|uniref:Serendipity locus protein delta n=1 Tax=Drosophila lebanonensis TaxID=7225 RepID=A0A6J2T8J4_DROLE|nr:serendipity locus protein delta [Scaptodrosophila lebanonensis]
MDTCFFCGAVDLNGSVSYECATTAKVPSSQKSVSLVLQHLANCIKENLNLKSDTKVCPRCFYELSEYDTIMVNLMTTQRKLTHQLKAALKSESAPDADSVDDSSLTGAGADEDTDVQEMEDKMEQDETEAFLVELVKDDGDVEIKDEYGDDEEFVCEVEVPQDEKLDSMDKSYMRKRDRVKQECSSCNKQFNSKYQLQKHMSEEHSKPQTHVCPICGIVRRDEEYLELHMNLHEGKTEKQCRYCPKSFSRPVNTLRHMRMHWNKQKYQCEKCGLRFSQDNLLYNHRLRHEAEENPIICSICNVSFKSRKTFNHHTLIHKENRPRHYCTVCPKSFTERYTLKMHMKTHEGDLVYGVREDAPADEQQVVEELQVDVDESEQQEAVTVIMSDNDENSGFCVICSTNFETKKELEHHLQFDHDVVFK